MSKYSVISVALFTALFGGCSADDDVDPADGCRVIGVEEASADRRDGGSSSFLYAARLRDGCLELVHPCCSCYEVDATATRSPLAVYPPI